MAIGVAKIAIGGVAGVLLVVAILIIWNVAEDAETGGTGTAGTQTCFTKCTWLREKRCEDNVDIGWCLGIWGCGNGVGPHTCVASNERREKAVFVALNPCSAELQLYSSHMILDRSGGMTATAR